MCSCFSERRCLYAYIDFYGGTSLVGLENVCCRYQSSMGVSKDYLHRAVVAIFYCRAVHGGNDIFGYSYLDCCRYLGDYRRIIRSINVANNLIGIIRHKGRFNTYEHN